MMSYGSAKDPRACIQVCPNISTVPCVDQKLKEILKSVDSHTDYSGRHKKN